MNAQGIHIYKIKNIQKTNLNGESFLSVLKLWNESLNSSSEEKINSGTTENIAGNAEKIKILPKRYMQDVSALFTDKKTDTIKYNDEANVFFTSLKDLNPKDIVLNEVAKNMKKRSFDFVRYFVLLLSMAIFVYSGYRIVGQLYSYVSAARDYDALRSIFYGDDEEDSQDAQYLKKTKINIPIQDILALQKQTGERFVEAEVSDGVRDVDKKRLNMHKLSDINPDLYCWIKVSFTTIDYPVVQTIDNDYYLNYSFEKKWSKSGAIYCDHRNSRDILENRNLVIYGHNMLDNSMFQPLIDFSKRYDYFQNGIIELITEDAMYYYEVFSANEEDPRSGYIKTDFASDEEYVEFLYEMKNRSIFQKNVVLDENSRIITLSTCVNDVRLDRRFVVRGVLIDVK
ncbi:MAG: class B sortase [Oscillospiraceae bacterium]|nr:class B sortase [Oscillospiraceae bacterium]